MTNRTIRVKIIKSNTSTVTVRLLSLNRDMPVKKDEFQRNLDNGTYQLVNPEDLEEVMG